MQNVYSLPTETLRRYWREKSTGRMDDLVATYIDQFTLQEMVAQMQSGQGVFAKVFEEDNRTFTNNTTNVEISTAIELSDLYFGENSDAEVGFEFKPSYRGETISSYDELIAHIESNTHIDCVVKSGKKGLAIQIKRYRAKSSDITTDSLKQFILSVSKKYGSLPNTVLAILLQPEDYDKNGLVWKDLSEALIREKDELAFSAVALILNGENKKQYLVQLYPELGIKSKEIIWLNGKPPTGTGSAS